MTTSTQYGIQGAGGGCFPAGAQVLVENGKTVAIESLCVGDVVLSFDEHGAVHRAKVTKTHRHLDPQPIWNIRYWNGSVRLTPNHWVLNQYGAFVEMGTMSTEDALIDQLGHLRPIIGIAVERNEPVYNLTVEPHHTFICDGIRVHNGGHRQRHPLIAEDIQGAGGDDKGGGGRTPYIQPDNASSKQMVSVLDALGEGAIGGLVDGAKSIFFDGTPLQNSDGTFNFEGVTWEQRTGTQDQSIIPGFSSVETPRNIGVQVKTTQPSTFTISNPNVDRVRVIVGFPALRTQDTTTGDVYGTSVSFHFDIATDDGPFVTVLSTTASKKVSSRWQQEYVLTLPKPSIQFDGDNLQDISWRVRMVRDTPDSTSETLSNDTYLDTAVEIVDSKLRYPNTAIIGVTVDSALFNKIPTRSYLVDGLYIKVPSNYDAATRQYTGIWNGTFKVAVSSNPAWILYDVLTSKRYGLGQFVAPGMVDASELYQVGRYCDEMVPDGHGGFEPRFEINTQIQTRVDAFKLVSDISSALRGMVYWAGSLTRFTQDRPREPSMRFTPANVMGSEFNRTGPSRNDRHSVVLVTWNDPTDNYKQTIEYVEDRELIDKYGIRQLEMIAFGCTSRGQANRAGRWVLYTEKYESNLISFKVGLDSANVLPGDVIEIHDPVLAGKPMGGRIKSCTLNIATLDAPVEIGALGDAKIAIRMPDGTFATRYITNLPGTTDRITWSSDLPELPLAGAIFIVSEETLNPVLAKVVGIKQGENPAEFEIAALEHNESKFAAIEEGLTLEDTQVSILNPKVVADPTGFKAQELTIEVAPGVVGLSLEVSWSANAASYEVTWRRTGTYATNWVTEFTTNPSLLLSNVRAGPHEFRVVAVNGFGARSRALAASYTTQGKTAAPGDVANFQVRKRTSDLLITWDDVTDIRVSGYEVRVGPDWGSATVITEGFRGTMITHDQSVAGTYYYHIRSINAQGVYSDNVSTFKLVLSAPRSVAGLDMIQNEKRLELRWSANPEDDIASYEVREGTAWVTGTLVGQVKATTLSIPSGSIGTRTFWIKAVASPGIYSDVAAFISNQVAILPDRNIVFTADESATGWPGRAINMHLVGNDLMMVDGIGRSEYLFDVDLLDRYRAANSLYAQLSSVAQDTDNMTWDTSVFTWESVEALRHWAPGGDVDSVLGRYQIAPYIGLGTGEIDGWRLDGTLSSVTGLGAAARTASSSDWGAGRFGQGFVPSFDRDFARWDSVAIPDTFVYTLWVTAQEDTNIDVERPILLLQNADGSRFLKLFYSDGAGTVYLKSDAGERIDVPASLLIDRPIAVSIVQTAAQRKLFVGAMDGQYVNSQIANYLPRGAFTVMGVGF